MEYLQSLEREIEYDLDSFKMLKPWNDPAKQKEKGIEVTKEMVLESSFTEDLSEVTGLVLKEKKIGKF